ncbi:MAG TPA: DUF1611 domain-containing protein [Candidatus Saccharimonadales bacterium]|nr:DUF1611 domain-containing protein [Candidatus Saccharimonadales bacterium]
MTELPEGSAIVYCEGAFGTPNGKTAHGLVRHTRRYTVLSVIDSRHAGADAREILDGRPGGIPVFADLRSALEGAGGRATHLVIGLAPDGGRLPDPARETVAEAVRSGLNVDSGLHDFLCEDPVISRLASEKGVTLRDVRKPPPRDELHFFSGKIEEVTSFRIALLGTDSAVGKRTTAWMISDALSAAGIPSQMIGTGQTAWMQGARFGIVMDSLINDFVSGEIEHAVWSAWKEAGARALVIEGQGSLMNPAYPGGFEILAAGRPHVIVMQHAPARKEYDGFPGYALHPIETQVRAAELLSGKPVVAVTLNHEGLDRAGLAEAAASITRSTGLPAVDVLLEGAAGLVEILRPHMSAAGTAGGR